MTEKDRKLILRAESTPWEFMDELADQCETDEAKWRIKAMEKDRYHREND